MAEEKQLNSKSSDEKEFIIPLKRAYLKGRRYDRTRLAIREIKRFLVRHMKIRDRNLNKIKLDPYFNNHVWSRGKFNPPTKIKVKVSKKEDLIIVDFADIPDKIKFAKLRNQKNHQESKKPSTKPEPTEQTPVLEKTESEKIDEKEKQKATAEAKEKIAEKTAKTEKHMAKVSKDKSSTKKRQVLSRH